MSILFSGFPGDSLAKSLPANAVDMGLIPGLGRSPGGGNGDFHSSILAWKISWTEEPGGTKSLIRLNTLSNAVAASLC